MPLFCPDSLCEGRLSCIDRYNVYALAYSLFSIKEILSAPFKVQDTAQTQRLLDGGVTLITTPFDGSLEVVIVPASVGQCCVEDQGMG